MVPPPMRLEEVPEAGKHAHRAQRSRCESRSGAPFSIPAVVLLRKVSFLTHSSPPRWIPVNPQSSELNLLLGEIVRRLSFLRPHLSGAPVR